MVKEISMANKPDPFKGLRSRPVKNVNRIKYGNYTIDTMGDTLFIYEICNLRKPPFKLPAGCFDFDKPQDLCLLGFIIDIYERGLEDGFENGKKAKARDICLALGIYTYNRAE